MPDRMPLVAELESAAVPKGLPVERDEGWQTFFHHVLMSASLVRFVIHAVDGFVVDGFEEPLAIHRLSLLHVGTVKEPAV